ncbi:carbon storage regulator CsrA [Alkaliphilus sp. MSJ-5]|uniref:Translational regulator CsrA n=1 Tax=Alkaliphilus flagellatus TaxID=2841507 RepID=A0ABS6G2I8_9FIRM|nr:carbon storage regulator CsrA [Alkaliphilus flagellatus]MBU5676690.1 carbon storage regulator CsrA [Alkaliphilus flagellatus]
MLVLSRRANESIMIGNDIEIKILGIDEGKVKLGIEAPKDVEICRREIYIEIEEENITASKQQLDIESLKGIFTQK